MCLREIDMEKQLASGRTVRQWEVCDPDRMMEMSDAAIRWALIDAKVDIMSLAVKLMKVQELATDGICHGLLADAKCQEILDVIEGHNKATTRSAA
jgi:hypothetical protein